LYGHLNRVPLSDTGVYGGFTPTQQKRLVSAALAPPKRYARLQRS